MVAKTVIKSKFGDYCGENVWYGQIINDFDGTKIRKHITREGRLVNAHIIFRNQEQVRMILDSIPDTFEVSDEELSHKIFWDGVKEKNKENVARK